MSRRAFLYASIAALARPVAAEAQQAAKIPRIGVLLNSPPTENLPDLRQGLRELGYIEGQNIVLDVLSAEGRLDRLPALAPELVRRKVDVIIASGPQGIGDAHGFVTNLARPGGNITGLSFQTGELAGKLVQLLKEAVPSLSRLAVIWDEAGTRNQVRTVQEAARALGLDRGLDGLPENRTAVLSRPVTGCRLDEEDGNVGLRRADSGAHVIRPPGTTGHRYPLDPVRRRRHPVL